MRDLTRRRWTARALAAAFVAAGGVALAPGCSLGEGLGAVSGELNVPDCWSGKFDLQPDFFAAVPYKNTLDIRVQNGGDFETFSDGVDILVDDIGGTRAHLNQALSVSLSPDVTPPGVPITAIPNPASVHLSLYLQQSCRTQNVALYAMAAVSLNANGTCFDPDGGAPPIVCAGGTSGSPPDAGAPDASSADGATDSAIADATLPEASSPDTGGVPVVPTAASTITFSSIFNGNPDETNAAQRLTQATFDVYLADPRDICPGGLGPPPPCRGHLTGNFKFYFQRGRPGQPFP